MRTLFSVGVRRKVDPMFANALSFTRVDKVYIVEAQTGRKAENVVARYLKLIGSDKEVVGRSATPAEMLNALGIKTGLARAS
jgi:hypothetical protein